MSNITTKNLEFNIWVLKKLENKFRDLIYKHDSVIIISGLITDSIIFYFNGNNFSKSPKTNYIPVPDDFYKGLYISTIKTHLFIYCQIRLK